MTDKPNPGPPAQAPADEHARYHLARGITLRVRTSVDRRTPFLSDDATNALAEDVIENVMAFLRESFDL